MDSPMVLQSASYLAENTMEASRIRSYFAVGFYFDLNNKMIMMCIYDINPDKMLHKSKISLASELGVDRTTITRMLKRGEVKEVVYYDGKRAGYVKVTDFIKYLLG